MSNIQEKRVLNVASLEPTRHTHAAPHEDGREHVNNNYLTISPTVDLPATTVLDKNCWTTNQRAAL